MKNGNSEVVVITGASAGVGRATARLFAQHGARLGLVARSQERLEATKQEVEAAGGQAVILSADVAQSKTAEQIAGMTEQAFGPIDVWVNNAMTSVYSKICDMPPEEFQRVTEVTYLGTVYGTLAALKRMLPRNRGAIVQVGSALAYRSIPFQSAYCAAKHATRGFTDSLRSELLHDRKKIRLSMVHLPSLNTPQFVWVRNRLPQKAKPPAPIYQPELAAEAICWAAHHDRREVFLGASTVFGIAMNKVAPGLLDRYLVTHSFSDTHEPRDPAQPDNLWNAPPGDPGARGPFDAEARERSPQLELSKRRASLSLIALGAVGTLAFARRGRRRSGATNGD